MTFPIPHSPFPIPHSIGCGWCFQYQNSRFRCVTNMYFGVWCFGVWVLRLKLRLKLTHLDFNPDSNAARRVSQVHIYSNSTQTPIPTPTPPPNSTKIKQMPKHLRSRYSTPPSPLSPFSILAFPLLNSLSQSPFQVPKCCVACYFA